MPLCHLIYRIAIHQITHCGCHVMTSLSECSKRAGQLLPVVRKVEEWYFRRARLGQDPTSTRVHAPGNKWNCLWFCYRLCVADLWILCYDHLDKLCVVVCEYSTRIMFILVVKQFLTLDNLICKWYFVDSNRIDIFEPRFIDNELPNYEYWTVNFTQTLITVLYYSVLFPWRRFNLYTIHMRRAEKRMKHTAM